MRETVEIRVPEECAKRFLRSDAGTSAGIARVLVLSADDPELEDIKRIDRQLRAEGRAFYTAWIAKRHYTRLELDQADLLHVWPKHVFEPAGEECGTTYDDAKACPECGAGAPQTGPLFLNDRPIPKNVDFAQTIAGEVVVSARVVKVFREHGLAGVEFDAIRIANMRGAPSEDCFQLKVVGPPVELDQATRAGEDPFDEDSYGRCLRGDVVGLNLLSEVTVKGDTIPKADVMTTRQLVGTRRGLLRPRPILLLSPRSWQAIEEEKLKGLAVEVARLV